MEKKIKENKKKLNSTILLIIFTIVLLIASTYAWFTTQKNVSIENLRGTVEVAEGLEISLDAKSWGQKIDLSNVSILSDAYADDKNIYPPELLPVSTIGETTEEGGTAVTDDRLTMVRATTLEDTKLTKTTLCNEFLEDALFADNEALTSISDKDIAYKTPNYPSYFAFDLFLRNTSRGQAQDGTGTPDTLQLDKNSYVTTLLNEFTNPAKALSYTGNPGSGLQNCVRVGFALYKNTTGVTEADTKIIEDTVSTANKISSVSIWEPNANAHVSYIVASNNKVKTGSDNLSLDATNAKFKADSQFFTYGLKKSVAGDNEVTDIYDWTGNGGDYLAKQVTVQTPAPEKQTVEDDGVTATTIGSVYDLLTTNSTSGGETPLQIKSNQISRMRIYLWIEGQDVDCVNYASFGGGIETRIGLTKGETEGVISSLATPAIGVAE